MPSQRLALLAALLATATLAPLAHADLLGAATNCGVPAVGAMVDTFDVDTVEAGAWCLWGNGQRGTYDVAGGALILTTNGTGNAVIGLHRGMAIDATGGLLEVRFQLDSVAGGGFQAGFHWPQFVVDAQSGSASLMYQKEGAPGSTRVPVAEIQAGTAYVARLVLLDGGVGKLELLDSSGASLGSATVSDAAITPASVQRFSMNLGTQAGWPRQTVTVDHILVLPAQAEAVEQLAGTTVEALLP